MQRDFTWDSSEGMKEEGLRKRSEKVGFFLFRYDEANRSGGDKVAGYSRFPRGGAGPHPAGPRGETPGSVGGRGGGEKGW